MSAETKKLLLYGAIAIGTIYLLTSTSSSDSSEVRPIDGIAMAGVIMLAIALAPVGL